MIKPTLFYKCLADDTRLKIMLLIAQEGELCVCELMVALQELSQPKISRHLAKLKQAGLLCDRKEKQWVFYRLNPALSSWVRTSIELVSNANSDFIAGHVQALNAMGERPARRASCC